MKELNKMRMAAGLPIDGSIEITEKKVIREARDTPRRKADLKTSDAKSLKAKTRGCEMACNHINAAIEALEKIPATDFGGEVPRFIGELEDLMDAGGEGGMEAYLEQCTSALRKADGIEKEAKRRQEEEEALADLEARQKEEDKEEDEEV